jgi:hypothetical protein
VFYGREGDGSPRVLGTTRWAATNADHVFEEPPETIKSDSATTREVLTSAASFAPQDQIRFLNDKDAGAQLALTHARWDDLRAPQLLNWMWLAQESPEFKSMLAARLQAAPTAAVLLRMEQDSAADSDRPGICARHQQAAEKSPTSADLQYIAARCMESGPDQDRAFTDAYKRFPQNGWLAMASGYTAVEQAQYDVALERFDAARRLEPLVAGMVADETARLRRLKSADGRADVRDLFAALPELEQLAMIESGVGAVDFAADYHLLAKGDLANAAQAAARRGATGNGLLLLTAASDGASDELVARARALQPTTENGLAGTLAGYAIAARSGDSLTPHADVLREILGDEADRLLSFLSALRSTSDPASVEIPKTRGMSERGRLLGSATMMLQGRTPAAWRNEAKRLLFVGERPYFE